MVSGFWRSSACARQRDWVLRTPRIRSTSFDVDVAELCRAIDDGRATRLAWRWELPQMWVEHGLPDAAQRA